MLLTAVPPYRLTAQTTVSGTVVRPAERDTAPVPDTRVVLHRVGRARQGPLDSTITDARGRFRFRFQPDTGTIYLVSARYDGIEYFSTPVPTHPTRPEIPITVLVHDTSSSETVTLGARHIVVPRPSEDGTRRVLDLLVLQNRGWRTRVTTDSAHPSWSGRLPAGILGFELGESDVSPDAVARRGDSVVVTAAIAPGDKQLAVEYRVPPALRTLEIPAGDSATVNLLIEEPEVVPSGAPLVAADTQVLEGRSFRRWSGDVPAGTAIRIGFPRAGNAPARLLQVMVSALALSLGLAWWRWAARPAPARATPSPDRLLDEIAALDLRYLGREGETTPDQWTRYQADRARLKTELEAALARRRAGR